MTPNEQIQALLAGAARSAGEQERAEARIAARMAWARQIIAALRSAQEKADQAWSALFDSLPEDMDEDEIEALPAPPEQAELDAILAEINAVRDHDRWPRELYWSL